MRRLRWSCLVALAAGTMLLTPAAQAQEYATETADLDIETSLIVTVTISGDGFVADSVVYVTFQPAVGGDEIELGTLATDEQGRFFGEISLPPNLEPGTHGIAATGVTSLGATRVLTATVTVPGGTPLDVASVPSSSTTLSGTTTTSRPPRGSGLAPLESGDTGADPSAPLDRILLGRALSIGVVALGGIWWWLYKAAQR